ncbi:MAG: PspA/IM30 family protein [Methylophaga sp.]|nr:PspA/IM30 family protein [Methylophaga sp.]
MALITRLSRLFHADMNAVLDQIEEPELLLKQAIREMEETLSNNERQIKLLDLEQQKLLGQENELKQSLTDLDKQLKLCFESDKDNLARSLVKRKLETTQYLKSVSTKISHSTETATHLKVQLKEQQSQLSSMKQKADIFKQDNTANNANWTVHSPAIQDEDIDIAFLDEKQKWSQS